MSDAVICAKNLGKNFGKKSAVVDMSFEIPRGTVCGLVGPNGAGKTSTIRMLMGLHPPSSGSVQVLGLNPMKEGLTLRQRIGYVPEKHHIYDWMKVQRVLQFVSECYPRWDWVECKRIVELLSLPMDRKVKELSRGELAKLALAVALGHKPELLILDEPTSGLDPLVRREFLTTIIGLIQKEERAVLFSTHILSDVERVADQVIVLNEGRIVANDGLQALRDRYTKVSFLFAAPPAADLQIPSALRLEKGLREWVAVFAALKEVEIKSLAQSLGATDCLIQPMTLEDVFVELLHPKGKDK